ncbi:DUF6099 family protein [Streptomyces sp. HPF1205]|uniref:DUF6099 family protein n=1 Tax=Streptomyces sp. HPF1205 TaxID=2873262 RepID=UPI001CEC11BB|nr:DUF6099 family protein [Streptomyces sp. HPF1205]
MDAARLVARAEEALRRDRRPETVVAEAWQAYELTEAVGRLLTADRDGHAKADTGPGESVAGADHAWPVVRAGPALAGVAADASPPRVVRLTSVRDPAGTLHALRVLLGEIGLALVDMACTAEDEAAYWLCIEALDAVDDAKDRVRELSGATPR